MSYITDFEGDLSKKLNSHEEISSVVHWVSEKILESYKHGIIAGKKGSQKTRKEQDSSAVSSAEAK
jgi:uncharacterized membrane-anchored protein